MALWLAVQTFAKSNHKTQAYMHLKMGNVSALTHVNHMGNLFSGPDEDSICTLGWCLQWKITISASYWPGISNQVADKESRQMVTLAEWKLHTDIFLKICTQFSEALLGRFICQPSESPTPHIYQLKTWPRGNKYIYFLDKLEEPREIHFPSFVLIETEQGTVILITPAWQNQPWFSSLLEIMLELLFLLRSLSTKTCWQIQKVCTIH